VATQGRQVRRATQTGDRDRPVPYVVVTAPSPDDRRHEPTLLRHVRSPANRPRLVAVSRTPDSASPDQTTASSAGDRDESATDRVAAGRVTPVDDRCPTNLDHTRRCDEQAELEAVLRELGVDTSSVNAL